MTAPFPPDPADGIDRGRRIQNLHEHLAEEFMRQGMETARRALAAYEKALRRPVPQPEPEAGRAYALDEALGWADIGAVVGIDYGYDPAQSVVVWPRQYGKQAFTLEFEGPLKEGARELFEQIFASIRARQDLMLARLARELGIWPEAARRQFDAVQKVLETAGIGDGYGQLTIPQPVRPPIALPVVPELVPVYTDPFEQLRLPPGARPPLTLCSWRPPPHRTPPA